VRDEAEAELATFNAAAEAAAAAAAASTGDNATEGAEGTDNAGNGAQGGDNADTGGASGNDGGQEGETREQLINEALDLVEADGLVTNGPRKGKPKVAAIEAITGLDDVTSAEIDAAIAARAAA
jgi:hypothetical protein